MSVAFRRESDEEHKEPRFDRPIPPGPNLVTPLGHAQIVAAIARLDSDIASGLTGDDMDAARRDLRYWRLRLATARIPEPPPAGRVGFGSHVRFRLRGIEQTLQITGSDEAEPSSGKVTLTAPLAQALMAAQAGELVDFQGISEAIEVIEVSPTGPAVIS